MSDASANALRVGISTGLIDERGATLLHAFWAPAKSKLRLAGSDQTSIDSYVADERQRTADEMSAFLAANGLSDTKWSVQLREGEATQVIAETVAQTRPDLLVMGTHGRSGLLKALIGSVTEQVLRSVSVDILAVPPHR
jgi:nucleotide-binding universal stress UspA family protein